MYVKTITYVDYFGQKQTRDFRFHLTDSELYELQYSTAGGFIATAQRMLDNHDQTNIFKTYKDLILKSYGEVSDDGQRFIKSEELSTAFSQTPAFDVMFKEITTSEAAQDEFLLNVLPGGKEKIQDAMNSAKATMGIEQAPEGITMEA